MSSCNVITPCGSFAANWNDLDDEPVSYSGSFDAISFFRQFLSDELVTGAGGRRIRFRSLEPDDLRGFCDSPERGIVVEHDVEQQTSLGDNAHYEPSVEVLDAVSPLDRIRLSGELAGKVKELPTIESALQRVTVAGRIAAILRELGSADASSALSGPDLSFPLAEASRSYSGISHSGNSRVKGDAEDYEKTINQAVQGATPFAETDAQLAVLAAEAAAFRAEYLAQYRMLMGVRANTYSGHVAGRSSLNSKQANARNSALDKAMTRFYAWVEGQSGRISEAVLRARSPEQLAVAQTVKDAELAAQEAKRAEKSQKSVEFMAKLISFKAGDDLVLGKSIIKKISKDREGNPSKLTFVFADGTKPFDDKIDLLKVLYRGDKDALRRDADAARELIEPPTVTPKQPISNVPSVGLKQHVLRLGYEGKGFELETGYSYLIARHKKTGRGIFVVAGNLDRPTFKAIIGEAEAAGIDSTSKMYVFGDTATYTGPAIDFIRLDSLPPFAETPP